MKKNIFLRGNKRILVLNDMVCRLIHSWASLSSHLQLGNNNFLEVSTYRHNSVCHES